jgi:hypothetical protein
MGVKTMVKRKQLQTATATVSATLERRGAPRAKANHPALLKRQDGHALEVWVLDVSSTGAHLRVPERVPVGARIGIEAQELLLFGTTTRCEPTHGAYDVGVALSRPLEMLGELQKLQAALLLEAQGV